MKNLLLVVCVCLSTWLHGQQFEGRIKWSVKMDFADTAQENRMNEARKKLRDPNKKGMLSESAAKVHDKTLTSRNDAHSRKEVEEAKDVVRGLTSYPTAVTISMKGQNALMKLDSIFPDYEILSQGDTARFVLERQGLLFIDMSRREREPAHKSDSLIKVEKTAETAQILGYKCTKYIVTRPMGATASVQEIWTTEGIKGFNAKSLSKQPFHRVTWLANKVPGVPLKMSTTNRQGTLTMQAVEVTPVKLTDDLFTVPKNFREINPSQMVR